jgi:SNF2 family DNA or RNA helicase
MTVQISAKRKLVGVPYSADVANLFPAAKRITLSGNDTLLLNHGAVETFMLRRLGHDVPAPILSHYVWPGFVQPFEVQKKTCSLLTLNQRAYVLNGMGTGKTKAMLWAWDFLRTNGVAGKLIVFAPLSTLNFTWAQEVFATLPHRKCTILHGDRARRIKRLADPDVEIFIINHDGLKVLYEELMNHPEIDTLGIDELAVFRNGQSLRTKTMKKYAAKMKWVWGMTGGPIPHLPTDAWAQASIVTPDTVPKYFGRFREELMLKVGTFKYVPKADAADRAFAALQPAVRFSLDEVTELPELVERQVTIDMGPKQAKVYKAMADHAYAMMQTGEITAANAGAVMMKLLQISTGWVYQKDGSVAPLDNDLRVTAMLDAVNATDKKVLVFVPFKHALAGISASLKADGIEHACVSGDTSLSERSEIFNIFQNTDKYKVIVAHPQCLAHGITLTAATTIIWFSPVTSLEIYEQANARIRRVGQTNKQLILNFQGTAVEKKIYSMLRQKMQVQNHLLDLFEANNEVALT